MAFDAFIKIPGVEGESTRKGFEKQIAILSFSLGASNPSSIGVGGGGGSGKASISSFNLMKHSDITSPLLFQACCQGAHYDKVTVTLNKAVDHATGTLGDVLTYTIRYQGLGAGAGGLGVR